MPITLTPTGPTPEEMAMTQSARQPMNPDYSMLSDSAATPSLAPQRKRRPMPGQGQGMQLKPATSLGAPGAGMKKGGAVRGSGCCTKTKKCKMR